MNYLSTKSKKMAISGGSTIVRDTLYHSSGMGSDSHIKETGMLIREGNQSGCGSISL